MLGTFAYKIGMSRMFDDEGKHIPVTILKLSDAKILNTKKYDNHNSVVLGFNFGEKSKIAKPQKGQLTKLGSPLCRNIREFKCDNVDDLEAQSDITTDIFSVGSKVDVFAKSKGKGFAGVMKRHNFRGLRASHGVSISHRSHGSTGHCQDPGRVFKGKKMAGQLGNKNVMVAGLEIVNIDKENNLVFVKGGVPGAKQSLVKVQKSTKK